MNKAFQAEVEKKSRLRKRQGVRDTSIVHAGDLFVAWSNHLVRHYRAKGMLFEAEVFADGSKELAQHVDACARLETRPRKR